jgi:hypothetical protein
MLSREQAVNRLKGFEIANWTDKRIGMFKQVADPLRTHGLLLLKRGESKELLAQAAAADPRWNNGPLPLTNEQTQQMLELLFPRMSDDIARALTVFFRLPYQDDSGRRPFRVVDDAGRTAQQIGHWLHNLIFGLRDYDPDILWLAEYAAYLPQWSQPFGPLFAAAIDAGGETGERIFELLIASANGDHDVAAMGKHVTQALMMSADPRGWEFVEKLLLAAQRSEGLRQQILESVDESHPQMFRRVLRVIRDNKLARFSAVVRAMDVWFGFNWNVIERDHTTQLNQTLDLVIRLLDSSAECAAMSTRVDNPQMSPHELYIALWCVAYEDAHLACKRAAAWIDHPSMAHAYAATHLLAQLQLPDAIRALERGLRSEHWAIVARAFAGVCDRRVTYAAGKPLFPALQDLIARLDADHTLKPVIWEWDTPTLTREAVVSALYGELGDRDPKLMLPWLRHAAANIYRQLIQDECAKTIGDSEIRQFVLNNVSHASSYVREAAFHVLAGAVPSAADALHLEGLLTSKRGDLRRGVLQLLLNQPHDAVQTSIERLSAAKHSQVRAAGAELRQAFETRSGASETQAPTLDDALGLMTPAQRSQPVMPVRQTRTFVSPNTVPLLRALDALINEHAQAPIKVEQYGGQTTDMLLGDRYARLPHPKPELLPEQDLERLPLNELWLAWWRNRAEDLRDADGFEVLRAFVSSMVVNRTYWYRQEQVRGWHTDIAATVIAPVEAKALNYAHVNTLLTWFFRIDPPLGAIDFALDALEHTLASVPVDKLVDWHGPLKYNDIAPKYWRDERELIGWVDALFSMHSLRPDLWQTHQTARYWRLIRWFDEPHRVGPDGDVIKVNVPRNRADLSTLMYAYEAGAANEHDLYDELIGERVGAGWRGQNGNFLTLDSLSRRKPSEELLRWPVLKPIYERCVARLIEVELTRGELPTAASEPVTKLRYLESAAHVFGALHCLGATDLKRGYSYSSDLGKADVLSRLVKVAFPTPDDTPASFAAQAKEYLIGEQRLIELGLYAPQWARFVEYALGWDGYAEAAYWLHAHTKDRQWSVDAAIRDSWRAQTSEYTPLDAETLLQGAVDVAWFHRVYQRLGAKRWDRLYDAAKLCAGGTGHVRARLFADAMLGRVKPAELTARIKSKRNQDDVRALGLIPLKAGGDDALVRYEVIQEFVRGAKKFGSQRQASETLAAEIGLANLARSAGYADPIRLEWAMEARALADLRDGVLEHAAGDVRMTLSIDKRGQPELHIRRGDKPVADLPAKLKKEPGFVVLKERHKSLGKQVARIRASLEASMLRGDLLTREELAGLFAHPMLRPMLSALLLISDTGDKLGYPVKQGAQLTGPDGKAVKLGAKDRLRIAHPHDLFLNGRWSALQSECLEAHRVQPFKQVFRELYVLTADEETEAGLSRRYAGHQVNPRQAAALLGARGWIVQYEAGAIKTYHAAGVTTILSTNIGFTPPAEVEAPVIETVHFFRRGEFKPMRLVDVPPRVFSETMRDLDLIVSVAHVGGVDPEASASTIEMRAALVRETARLLKLGNIQIETNRVLIAGALNRYSVHLGSGSVHQQPGGQLCIVPVHSQHRGRIFVPFADDDPRTAEVVSKVVLLAQDDAIKDPTILTQIVA